MRLLLTGGNRILQRSMVAACRRAGHTVRLVVEDTDDPAVDDPAQIEPSGAVEVFTRGAVDHAAHGCDMVITVDLSPRSPDERGGAAGQAVDPMLAVAAAAGASRVVHVRSRAAGDVHTPIHAPGSVPRQTTIRTTLVYGIGDDPITLFLIMMRSLPVVPLLGRSHVVQPVWHEDLATAIVASLEVPDDEAGSTFDVAGPDTVTHGELYDLVGGLIDRRPPRVPVPDFLAVHGARLGELLGGGVAFEQAHLALAREDEGPLDVAANALTTRFGVSPIGIGDGLARLIQDLAEVTPDEGTGGLEAKRFTALIQGSRYKAGELLRLFRARFGDVMPVPLGVEPAAPDLALNEHAVISMHLPGRGHVQVRVEEVTPGHVIVATLRGHALAGVVRFSTKAIDDAVQFDVFACAAPSNPIDWLALTVGGSLAQGVNWRLVVSNVVKLSGGTSDGVQTAHRRLEGAEAESVQGWIHTIIERQRQRHAVDAGPLPRRS